MITPFNHLSVQGYRRLGSIDLDLRPLTTLIGANGIGKTSMLDVFSLLSASANGQLANKLLDLGGLSEILTREKTDSLSFKLSLTNGTSEPLIYDLQLGHAGPFYSIRQETLIQPQLANQTSLKYIDNYAGNVRYYDTFQGKLVQPEWVSSASETFLSQIPKMLKPAEEFRRQLASVTHYSAYALNVGPKSPIRLPQSMRPAPLPGKNGEDLVAYLYYLRETDQPRFEAVEDTLAVAFTGFEHLQFPPVAAGTLALTWKDKNFSRPLYMNDLSEGTLRFLWLVALLHSPALTTVTLIDEPEVSLHPELLNILSELLRETSRHTQLMVATHSDRLVGFLQPEEVLVLDQDAEGLTQMTWAEQLDLDHWLEEYSLDELWRLGRLGGRA